MKSKIVLIAILIIAGIIEASAIPNEQWNKLYPCYISGFQYCNSAAESVQQVSDGFVFAGNDEAFNLGSDTYSEPWLRKTDLNGNVLWKKKFLEIFKADIVQSVRQTSDKGYILAGTMRDSGLSNQDAMLIKTDSSGNKLWSKTFGGSGLDNAKYALQATDGGYILAGSTSSYGAGGSDAWLIKTDSNGNKIWSKTFGGTGTDYATWVQQTKDGGYVITGTTNDDDVLLLKTDSNGNKLWMKTFGGTIADYNDYGNSVQQTTDGGYILTGTSYAYGVFYGNAWAIKTDSNGNRLWSKTFDTSKADDYMYSVQQTTDGGYIFAGETFRDPSVYGECDAWIIKTDSNGNKLWDKIFGGTQCDRAKHIQQTKDGGYIFVGNKGKDAWLFKLGEPGITVVSPNGGENWIRGTNKEIKWRSTGSPGANVKIELYKGGVFNKLITSSTSNDGSYYWLVPTTQIIAADYKIKVTSTSNSAYTDQSNNNFIISAGSITVISPNGGENWAKGSTHTITWTKTGDTGSYVKIELLKGGVVNRVISSSTANDGSYSWIIPSTQAYGTDYKIRITSLSNSIYKDASNNNFKIY